MKKARKKHENYQVFLLDFPGALGVPSGAWLVVRSVVQMLVGNLARILAPILWIVAWILALSLVQIMV